METFKLHQICIKSKSLFYTLELKVSNLNILKACFYRSHLISIQLRNLLNSNTFKRRDWMVHFYKMQMEKLLDALCLLSYSLFEFSCFSMHTFFSNWTCSQTNLCGGGLAQFV